MTDTLTKEERAYLSIIALCGPYAGELVRALNTIDALEAERDEAITDNHTLADAHTSAVLLGGMVMADRAELVAMLRQLEWGSCAAHPDRLPVCWCCDGDAPVHIDDCALAALLARMEDK